MLKVKKVAKKAKVAKKTSARLGKDEREARNAGIRADIAAGKSVSEIAKERGMSYVGVRYIAKVAKAVKAPKSALKVSDKKGKVLLEADKAVLGSEEPAASESTK